MRTLRVFVPAFLCAALGLRADVLDDAGVKAESLARNSSLSLLQGVPLSEANVAIIEKTLAEAGGRMTSEGLEPFYEARGEFAKALEKGGLYGLHQVRLLVRAGRGDDAKKALRRESEEELLKAGHFEAMRQLREACRPLEDAGDWAGLAKFLDSVSALLPTPAWQAAVWAEQLDVAWHLDQLPALLTETDAKDRFKLCFFHSRLGNRKQSDALAAALIKEATPERLLEMFRILPSSAPLKEAVINRWDETKLTQEDRQSMLALFNQSMNQDALDGMLQSWLNAGGDPAPHMDLIWDQWMGRQQNVKAGQEVLEKLHRDYPAEPRYAILLARAIAEEDPGRAATLFEAVAKVPFQASEETAPLSWGIANGRLLPKEAQADPAFVALAGLGDLSRQDRVKAILDARPDFAALPTVDRVRYLAAGRMDHEFVKTILDADLSLPENAILQSWLFRVLMDRDQNRVIPAEIFREVAVKFAALTTGSEAAAELRTRDHSSELFKLLVEKKVDPEIMKKSLVAARDAAWARSESFGRRFTWRLGTEVKDHPEYKAILDVVPKVVPVPAPAPVAAAPAVKAVKEPNPQILQATLQLFSAPQIRRIVPEMEAGFERQMMSGRLIGAGASHPVELLWRWRDSMGGPMGNSRPLPQTDNVDLAALRSLMKGFGKDHPRRLVAEVLIDGGMIQCGDEGLTAEAKESMQALVEGKKEARGNEAFRYVALIARQAPEASLAGILDELKQQPPSVAAMVRQRLLASVGRDPRNWGRIEMLMESPASDAADPAILAKEAEQSGKKLLEMQAKGQLATLEAIETAGQVLDAAIAAQFQAQLSPRRGPRGYDPRMGPMMRPPVAAPRPIAPEVAVAFRALTESGDLAAWQEGALARFRLAGMKDAEILRWFQRHDPGATNPESDAAIDYARRILKLDPSDAKAADTLIQHDVKKANADGLIKTLKVLRTSRLDTLAEPESLSVIGVKRAAELLDVIVTKKVGDPAPRREAVTAMHRFFHSADKALAARFREWLGRQQMLLKDTRVPLAAALANADDMEGAAEVMARAFSLPKPPSGEPWGFPPKEVWETSRRDGRGLVAVQESDLEFLKERKLHDAVIKRAVELDNVPPLDIATLRLGSTPTVETFEREVLPLLTGVESMARSNQMHRWIDMFEKIAGAEGLALRLNAELLEKRTSISSLGETIRRIAEIPGSGPEVSRLWMRMSEAMEQGLEKKEMESAVYTAGRILLEMMESADDVAWASYWKWSEANVKEIDKFDDLRMMTGGFPETVPPARLRQVMPRYLREKADFLNSFNDLDWAISAIRSEDPAIAAALKAKLPPESEEAARLCDLAQGITAGMEPRVLAQREPDGEILVYWNLVSMQSSGARGSSRRISFGSFPAIDGKFDIQVTAGPDAASLKPVEERPGAAWAGNVRLKADPNVKFVSLAVREVASGITKATKPIPLTEETHAPLELSKEEMDAKKITLKPMPGPGALPAYQVALGNGGRVDLKEIPWTGTEPIYFGGWISGGGRLLLVCLDAGGRELGVVEESAADVNMKAWHHRSITVPEMPLPPGTARVALSFVGIREPQVGGTYFSFSDLRWSLGRLIREKPRGLPSDSGG